MELGDRAFLGLRFSREGVIVLVASPSLFRLLLHSNRNSSCLRLCSMQVL